MDVEVATANVLVTMNLPHDMKWFLNFVCKLSYMSRISPHPFICAFTMLSNYNYPILVANANVPKKQNTLSKLRG